MKKAGAELLEEGQHCIRPDISEEQYNMAIIANTAHMAQVHSSGMEKLARLWEDLGQPIGGSPPRRKYCSDTLPESLLEKGRLRKYTVY